LPVNRSTLRAFFLVAAVTIVAGTCIRLGFWQLARLEQRRASNARIEAAATLPPLSLDRAGFDSVANAPESHLFRPAIAGGTFDPTGEVILRGRSHDGRPGVHLVTPLRLDDGGVILVNRGWLPSPDAATVDPRPYRTTAHQRLAGTLQTVPRNVEDALPLLIEVEGYPVRSYRRLDADTLSTLAGEPVAPLYLQITPDPAAEASGLPVPIPLPALDEGPHLGYAIQWFSFAAIAVIGLVVVWGKGRRGEGAKGREGGTANRE
jgi:surfeit locus 1 family protein